MKMKTYITRIIQYRFIVLVLLFVITTVFGAVASQGIFASSIGTLFFGDDHPGFVKYKQRIREFVSDEVFIIIYRDTNLLSEESLERLQNVIEKIEEISEVGRIDSLLNAQHTFAIEDTLYVNKYADEALEQPDNTGKILENMTSDPLLSGLLISQDGYHAAIIIELTPDENRPAEVGPQIVKQVLKMFEQTGFEQDHLHRVGLVSTFAEIIAQTNFNIARLFPLGCLILLVVVFIMFHRFWPVVITSGVALIGVIWTYGFAVLLDRNINIFVSLTPVIILIVATSDIIHLCSAYLLELAKGLSKPEAIILSGVEVGTACFWTSATTFVGFVSMSFIPIPAFQQLGVVLGFGVAVSLLLAMTLTPILFWFMKAPEPHTYDASWAQRLLSRSLLAVEQEIFHRPWTMVVLFTLFFVWSLVGVTRITVETDLAERLDKNNRVRLDETYYNTHFAGANFLEIFVETSEVQGILDPEIFTKIEAFQNELENMPEVDSVISVIDLVNMIDREMNPEPYVSGASEVPGTPVHSWTQELLAQYLLLFEMSGGEDLDRFVDFERKTMRLAARLSESATVHTYLTGEKIRQKTLVSLGKSVDIEVTGINYLLGGFVDDVITGQKRGIWFAFASIMFMMIFMLRSWKLGMWSMIPNILPLLALGGYIGFFWDKTDSDTIVIAMIAIGIGVDDTIHFLSRLRFESSRSADADVALQNTFHFSGRAMVTTTIILVCGFMPLGLSDYFSVRIFGTLLPLTLVVAILADILLVPALVKLGVIRFQR